ncbi:NAD(P)/FAD-dependent oxidoreductase [Roseivirga echinicomitans]|uniref:FAD-dependent oxidoreductase n=1 Tax=Roseivirga echinicomitans TaxID=296218 RepID=A0A150XXR3_9BACT|nr:NAD(P)/FAD-dependent oxidoreductase [Roseivirga echinicomitans]KYG83569.1 FAD-dependent oxidoreductase [Roseivirga echinicomitans]
MKKIAIIGGGLAGLVTAARLSRLTFEVLLFEKKQYPFHKVCGEYLSNEVLDFMKREDLMPKNDDFPQISRFQMSALSGQSLTMPLDLGGFGISRYVLDDFLANKARESGAQVIENTSISEVEFIENQFELKSISGEVYHADLVIGAYGKNGVLDKKLERNHLKFEAPFIGVKHHIKTDFPRDLVALHNFEGGYCGIVAIENDQFNLCYLGRREDLKRAGSVEEMEEKVLKANPFLKSIFDNAEFVHEKPVVINAFSFRPKKLIENHILMSGDTAGLITPLCGNGMAMAIHSAKILSDAIADHASSEQWDRKRLESAYSEKWNATFKRRLWVGRKTQSFFGSKWSSNVALSVMRNSPALANQIMKNTHGKPF